jgi:hypothetical protein
MVEHEEAFVGIDVAKLRNAVAVADSGRMGEVRYLGEFDADEASMRRLVQRLAAKHEKMTFYYEAGPTGYGLHRLSAGADGQRFARERRLRWLSPNCGLPMATHCCHSGTKSHF